MAAHASTAGPGLRIGAALAAPSQEELHMPPPAGLLVQSWRKFRRRRTNVVALSVLGVIVVLCMLGPSMAPWAPTEIDRSMLRATGPSRPHPIGTDTLGRDQLARLLSAGRISLTIGLAVALICATIGAVVGVVSGYFGRTVDAVLMWIVDVLLSIPPLILLIAMAVLVANPASSFGALFAGLPEHWRIILVMSSLGWMSVARVVRSQVLSLREREYVEACHALGASHARIMFRHILPNAVPSIVVFSTFGVAAAIMAESGLSFLGVGVNPPTATWGNMVYESADLFSLTNYPWLALFPIGMIIATVLCISYVGEAARAALDPGD